MLVNYSDVKFAIFKVHIFSYGNPYKFSVLNQALQSVVRIGQHCPVKKGFTIK